MVMSFLHDGLRSLHCICITWRIQQIGKGRVGHRCRQPFAIVQCFDFPSHRQKRCSFELLASYFLAAI